MKQELHYASDVHAFLTGAISIVLDFARLEAPLRSRIYVSEATCQKDGTWLPDWSIRVVPTGSQIRFRLRLEQLPPEEEEAT